MMREFERFMLDPFIISSFSSRVVQTRILQEIHLPLLTLVPFSSI